MTNQAFTSALAAELNRPAFIPMPEAAVKLAFGEMGEETLLISQRAIPERLLAKGFKFQHPTIAEGVRAALTA